MPMQRRAPSAAEAAAAREAGEDDTTPASPPSPPPDRQRLQTEFEFELPRGYVDHQGKVHRRGVMRLATARDELAPLADRRVRENEAYLTVSLLSRVVTRLGEVPHIDTDVIESLFASDLAFLQDLYRRINQEGHTHVAVQCPSCEHEFTVDVSAGDGLGGS